jgi:tetratricopeptide (TPR) repeat protein
LAHLGKTREAMAQYAAALLIQPDFPEALDGLAWILSTTPDSGLRNGGQAIGMAERACDLSGRKDPAKLKTLAAAYAESGRYQEAGAMAQSAHDLAISTRNDALAGECLAMAEEFKASRPWRIAPQTQTR